MNEETFSIDIPLDENGYIGRECPIAACLGYFKITPGTGLPGAQCTCPYCGHSNHTSRFTTPEQNEYATSVVLRQISDRLLDTLRAGLPTRPVGGGLLSISFELKESPPPIYAYRERQLEQRLTCGTCSLAYAIYGVFGYCPDCREHNSRQILEANFETVDRLLGLASGSPVEVRGSLVSMALSEAVSAFDGFGRQLLQHWAKRATDPEAATRVSFQAIDKARTKVQGLFSADLAADLTPDDWTFVLLAFQKRHLFAHKMGVIDQQYLSATGLPGSMLGRKVEVSADEVSRLNGCLRLIAHRLVAVLQPPPSTGA